MKDEQKAKGGIARAAKLSPEQRSEIAKKAAVSRWENAAPKATHTGELRIGEQAILCHVLEDGSRVISGNAIQRALGFPKNASGMALKNFIDSKLLMFLPLETKEKLENPLRFIRIGSGGSVPETHGYDSSVFIDICDAVIDANKNELLTPAQKKQAIAAEMIIRSVAKVGLVALIDEATGYQELRDKKALQALLDKYLAKELATWAKRFPNEFYQQIFRLKGWNNLNPLSGARPGVVGKYTIDLVYERLAPGLLKELEQINPKNSTGNRAARHHQWLTPDVGHPALSQHLHATIGFMKFCSNWDQFMLMMDTVYPKKGHAIPLNLE